MKVIMKEITKVIRKDKQSFSTNRQSLSTNKNLSFAQNLDSRDARIRAFWIVVLFSGFLILGGFYYFLSSGNYFRTNSSPETNNFKRPIMRVALVADSHNENELLGRALRQAQGKGINFVIGLGDYTNLGTLEELENAKREFDKSGLEYYLTAGDRDGWDSREKGLNNFVEVFGNSTQLIDREKVLFVLLDNSNLYEGISSESWELLSRVLDDSNVASGQDTKNSKLTFVFLHKTPFHPQSSHIMGEDSEQVAKQARELIELIENKNVDGIFSGDLHFFAKFNSPSGSVKITTIGAIASERNFQGPRFAVLTVWDDYSWEVEDVEIRMNAN